MTLLEFSSSRKWRRVTGLVACIPIFWRGVAPSSDGPVPADTPAGVDKGSPLLRNVSRQYDSDCVAPTKTHATFTFWFTGKYSGSEKSQIHINFSKNKDANNSDNEIMIVMFPKDVWINLAYNGNQLSDLVKRAMSSLTVISWNSKVQFMYLVLLIFSQHNKQQIIAFHYGYCNMFRLTWVIIRLT
jgi:hypothetical protein